MEGESMSDSKEIVLQAIARHINCLSEENRNTRKRAIQGILKEVISRNPELTPCEFQGVLDEIIKPILKVLSDPVEKCRELCVELLAGCLKKTKSPADYLVFVIPVFVQRLGQQDIVEPSEEVRLSMVMLLSELVTLCKKSMAPYTDDMVKILAKTVMDAYPEVKKESCKCVSSLAESTPEQFHMQSESMIKPLLTAVSHQHSRVRVEVVLAIGNVIQFGNNKSVDDVVSHLAQRLFDQAPIVRAAVIQVVGNWLLDLLDRYSFWRKLIPLLLTGTQDEMPDIREQAAALWHDVGLKYESENEKDLKDKMDFIKADPEHYPPNIDRPNLGCRQLIYHHYSAMLSGLSNDIGDWVVDTRIKSAQLLYCLLINEEENVTMHMEKTLTTLVKAAGDEEPKVVENVIKCGELIGYFVPPDIWVKQVLRQVKLLQTPGMLRILAAVIRGCQRQTLKPFLHDIANVITDADICHIAESRLQMELLACVSALMQVCAEDVREISFDLFTLLVTLLALARSEDIEVQASALLSSLASVQNLANEQQLFELHTHQVIDSLQGGYSAWTQHSTERLVFDTLLINAGPVVGELLESIIPMLVINLQPTKDAELRLKFFTLLSKLMLNAGSTLDSHQRFGEFCVIVVRDMILPNCVWKAGRTAGAIRTVAVSCLWALLQSGIVTAEKLNEVIEETLIQLRSTLEDDNKSTRLLSCRVLTHLFNIKDLKFDQDKLHQMYPDLLKRLDDSSDDIRVACCQTFISYLSSFIDYEPHLYRAHYEAIYKGLLIHLDDPERSIQEAVLEVLKKASEIDPRLLLREIDSVKHKHRSTHYCDILAEYTHALPKPDS